MNKTELIKFYEDELNASVVEFQKVKKKFPDFRKVKKNDMRYGELMDRMFLIEDFIEQLKKLENKNK
jgi:hypothetical protein